MVVDGPREEKAAISGTCGAAASSAARQRHDLGGRAARPPDVVEDAGAVDVVEVHGRDRVVVAVE